MRNRMLGLDVHRRVRVGVTGLSAAGKTVFLTALVHALRYRGTIANVSAVREGRIKGVEILPLGASETAANFPYEENCAAIAPRDGLPRWPQSTDRVSKILLSLRYRPANSIAARLGDQKLLVELIDYPGEWLLDLWLQRYDYERWSQDVMREMETPESGPEARRFLEYINSLDYDTADVPDLEYKAQTAARLFKDYVVARRNATGRANKLHPGRFLLPGPGQDENMPALTFAPLPPALGSAWLRQLQRRHTLRRVMTERFDSYQSTVVRPFFRKNFARLDKQVVLVDLLGHLMRDGGGVPLLDGELRDIQSALRIGRSWLPRQLYPTIDKVLYASTKADLVPAEQHDVLLERMQKAVGRSNEAASYRGARTKVMTLASLLATREVTAEDRPDRRYVAGLQPDGQEYMHSPGNLARAATFEEDDDPFPAPQQALDLFEVQRFLPPPGLSRKDAWPHRRLDKVIEFLLGGELA